MSKHIKTNAGFLRDHGGSSVSTVTTVCCAPFGPFLFRWDPVVGESWWRLQAFSAHKYGDARGCSDAWWNTIGHPSNLSKAQSMSIQFEMGMEMTIWREIIQYLRLSFFSALQRQWTRIRFPDHRWHQVTNRNIPDEFWYSFPSGFFQASGLQ